MLITGETGCGVQVLLCIFTLSMCFYKLKTFKIKNLLAKKKKELESLKKKKKEVGHLTESQEGIDEWDKRRTEGPAHAQPFQGFWSLRAMCVLVTQTCPTLCDSMDCSPSGSFVHRIFQARILEWVATSFSRGSSQPRDGTWFECRQILCCLSHQGSP